MKPPAFSYFAPGTAREVVELLAQYGGDARVLAGGQSLVPLMNLRMIRPAVLIDLNRCPELDYIEQRGSYIAVGAMTRQIAATRSPLLRKYCSLVSKALELTGPVAVRSRSTVGGTIAHADRVAELPAVAVALDAVMVIESSRGKREVAATDFFLGDLSTAVEADEFLREVRFPVCDERSHFSFTEVGVRQEGVAVVGLAVHILSQGARVQKTALVAMGVDSAPVRLKSAESELMKRGLVTPFIEEIVRLACEEIDPMPDPYTTAAYRKHAVGALMRKALQAAAMESAK